MYDKRFLLLTCLVLAAACTVFTGCSEDDTITTVTTTGRIVVNPEPAGQTIAWTLRGPGGFLETGTGQVTFNDVTLGDYTLTWGDLDGYVPPIPASLTLQLLDGETLNFNGLYRQNLPSIVTVDCEPDGIGIGWTLVGPDGFTASGTEDDSFTDLSSGQYTILWRTLFGWWKPVEFLVTEEIFGGELVLTGTYREDIIGPTGYEFIPSGSFLMGSPDDEWGRSTLETLHAVTLTRGLFVKRSEMTNAQYLALARWAQAEGYLAMETVIAGEDTSFVLVDTLDDARTQVIVLQASEISFDPSDNSFDDLDASKVNLPVTGLNWFGAAAACDWLNLREGFARVYDHADWSVVGDDFYGAEGYRLPTEAEWEYLCRAGSTTAFTNGPLLNPICVDPNLQLVAWNCMTVSKPVMRKNPNAWDLFDMHGNLAEWCQDAWAAYPEGDAVDPVLLEGTGYRVLRGGDWNDTSQDCRSASRARFAPTQATVFIGLRPVRSVMAD